MGGLPGSMFVDFYNLLDDFRMVSIPFRSFGEISLPLVEGRLGRLGRHVLRLLGSFARIDSLWFSSGVVFFMMCSASFSQLL